jgi:hypothetical protein
MLLQSGPVAHAWPASAIHDTIAVIVRQAAYQRSLRVSLLERIFGWLRELWDRLTHALGAVPHGRGVAVALALAAAALVIARVVYAARLRDETLRATRSRPRGRAAPAAPWDDAQQLAAAGRYTEAAQALYRALLHTLAVREHVRLHPSKTSGDYARELRARDSPLFRAFRQFGRRYDRVLFGTGAFDAAGYAQLLADARPVLQPERSP